MTILEATPMKSITKITVSEIKLYSVVENYGESQLEETLGMYSDYTLAKALVDTIVSQEDPDDEYIDYSICIIEYVNINGVWNFKKVLDSYEF